MDMQTNDHEIRTTALKRDTTDDGGVSVIENELYESFKEMVLGYLHIPPSIPAWFRSTAPRKGSRIESIAARLRRLPNQPLPMHLNDYEITVLNKAFGLEVVRTSRGYKVSNGVRFVTNPLAAQLISLLEKLWHLESVIARTLECLLDSEKQPSEATEVCRQARLHMKIVVGRELIVMHMLTWPDSILTLSEIGSLQADPEVELRAVRACLTELGFAPGVLEQRYKQSVNSYYQTVFE